MNKQYVLAWLESITNRLHEVEKATHLAELDRINFEVVSCNSKLMEILTYLKYKDLEK